MNNVELVNESFSNIGKNWVRIKFNLEYNFNLKNCKDIISYLNNVDMFYKDWELDNVGYNYNAILLRGTDGIGNIKYMILRRSDIKSEEN